MTKLCAVVTGIDTHDMVSTARTALDTGADMVELRIDHMADPRGELTTVIDALADPTGLATAEVAVSVRTPGDGGAYRGTEEERLAILEDLARSAAKWLDVEGSLPVPALEALSETAHSSRTGVLVSWHLGSAIGKESFLEDAISYCQDAIADVVKVVVPADDRRGLDAYLSLASEMEAEGIRHVLLPSGRLSRVGRMLAPVTGTEWVYCETGDGDPYAGPLGLPRHNELAAAWRRTGLRTVSGEPKRPAPPLVPADADGDWTLLALLGDPVAHTNSPVIHHTAMHALGMRGSYIPYRTSPGDVGKALEDLRAAGATGCNVTVPLKVEAASTVDSLGDGARRSGAVNTIVFDGDGSTRGENTDADGVRLAAGELLGPDGHGMTALVLGTGGAARGAISGLIDWGAQVVVTGRDVTKVETLCSDIEGHARPVDHEGLDGLSGMVDILVQCTSQGMPGVLPEGPVVPQQVLTRVAPIAIVDMVYARGGTDLVRAARDQEIPASGGERVLLYQAMVGFDHWTGLKPPMDDMDRALMAVLG
jgi:shikimate dehydrogenase